jgi:hypothetical protein
VCKIVRKLHIFQLFYLYPYPYLLREEINTFRKEFFCILKIGFVLHFFKVLYSILRPLDSTVSEDARIEPRTVNCDFNTISVARTVTLAFCIMNAQCSPFVSVENKCRVRCLEAME